jgi:hypothetical protein
VTRMDPSTVTRQYEFDVAFSFAGEDREFVEEIVTSIKTKNVRVFYDNDHSIDMWGEDWVEYLGAVYGERARYAIIFISRAYVEKMWTVYERRVVLARALESAETYVLPVRLDDTPMPGLRSTVGYIDARRYGISGVINSILAKVSGGRPAAANRLTRVPRTEIERQWLLADRPLGWEQMYLAAQLLHGRESREDKYRDYRMHFALPTGEAFRSGDAVDYLTASADQVRLLIANFTGALSPEVQERALGPLGQAGDAAAIAHLAKRWNDIYEGLMDWTAKLRGVSIPSEFHKSVKILASYTEKPVDEFRGFVDHIVAQCDRFPALIEAGERPQLQAQLILIVPDETAAALRAEINRIADSLKRAP